WWAVNRDASVYEMLAGFVYILDTVCEVSEISAARVIFRIPVVGEFKYRGNAAAHSHFFYLRCFSHGISRCLEKNVGESPRLAFIPVHFFHAEQCAVEVERCINVADAK